ncbi:F-box/LRR-repeat protein At4g14103-like [Durio zibethinus]|uniref:F-box/LRR-repeat protein At4g14103-like n=1 Tax=Durio zibethinus TaxID=66656 RepID=A0A6P5WY84_DURZI|nr:F-box/LRR-repeat protein At4g14103-like [Durio zibethinus]
MVEGEPNRITNLFDPLLEHIISFLPINDAVRTSVLSKRWKDLWISHPYISFDDNVLTDDHTTGHEEESNTNRSIRTIKFIRFVDKVLLDWGHDKPIIKKLQLSYRDRIGASEFARWFRAVLRDGLEELDLHFGRFCERPFSCLIPCNSLVTLKLNFGAL